MLKVGQTLKYRTMLPGPSITRPSFSQWSFGFDDIIFTILPFLKKMTWMFQSYCWFHFCLYMSLHTAPYLLSLRFWRGRKSGLQIFTGYQTVLPDIRRKGRGRKSGKWTWYPVSGPSLSQITRKLHSFLRQHDKNDIILHFFLTLLYKNAESGLFWMFYVCLKGLYGVA